MDQASALNVIAITQIVLTSIIVIWLATVVTVFIKLGKKIKPIINTLTSTSEKITQSADILKKSVEGLTTRVDNISKKAETTADKIESSVYGITTAAQGTAEKVTQKIDATFGPKFLTVATAIGTAYKAFSIYKGIIDTRHHKEEVKKVMAEEIDSHI